MNAQELYQELLAVTTKFHQFAQQTEQHGTRAGGGFVSGFRGAIGGIGSALGSVGSVLSGTLGALGIGVGIHAIVDEIKSLVEYGTQIEDFSQRFGVSAHTLSALSFQAEKTGTSLESLGKGIGFLEKTRDKALQGDEKLRHNFEQLGVSLKDLQNLRTDELLKRIGDSSLSAADLVKIMGRNALELRPLLDDIGRGVVDFDKGISDADAKKIKEVTDAFIDLKASVVTELLPALSSVLSYLADISAQGITAFAQIVKHGGVADAAGSIVGEGLGASLGTALAGGDPTKPTRDRRDFGKGGEAEEIEDKELARKKDRLEKEERARHLAEIGNDAALAELRAEQESVAASIAKEKNEDNLVDLKLKQLAILKEIDSFDKKKDREDDSLEKNKERLHKLQVGELQPQQRRAELAKELADIKGQESKAKDEDERVQLAIKRLEIEKQIDSLDKSRASHGGRGGHGTGPTIIDAHAPQAVVKHGLETGHVQGASLEARLSDDEFHAQFRGRGADTSSLRAAVERRKAQLLADNTVSPGTLAQAEGRASVGVSQAKIDKAREIQGQFHLAELFNSFGLKLQPNRAGEVSAHFADKEKHAESLKEAGKELKDAAKVLKGALTNK